MVNGDQALHKGSAQQGSCSNATVCCCKRNVKSLRENEVERGDFETIGYQREQGREAICHTMYPGEKKMQEGTERLAGANQCDVQICNVQSSEAPSFSPLLRMFSNHALSARTACMV